MTPVEEDIVATFRRIKELARVRCSSGKHAGKHAQRIRTKLCSATLRLQSQLRRIRRDSAGFHPIRERIDVFLLSPQGIALRRQAAAWLKEGGSRVDRRRSQTAARETPTCTESTVSFRSSVPHRLT